MNGPFTTITVEEYYRLKDRVQELERTLSPIVAWMMTQKEFVVQTCAHGLLYDAMKTLDPSTPLTKDPRDDSPKIIGGPNE